MPGLSCRHCECTKTWVPTYCNFGHCAGCFAPLEETHDECGWDGVEHESYGPSLSLPGNVHVGDCDCGFDPQESTEHEADCASQLVPHDSAGPVQLRAD